MPLEISSYKIYVYLKHFEVSFENHELTFENHELTLLNSIYWTYLARLEL